MINQATPELNAALAIAKLSFEPIVADETAKFKTNKGSEIKFDYANLEDIIPAVTEALSAQGLSMSSAIAPVGDSLFLVTSLLHSSGQQRDSYYPLPATVSDPKEFGSCISFGRRRNTVCLLEINIIEADDKQKYNRQVKAAEQVREHLGDAGKGVVLAPVKKTTAQGLYPQQNSMVAEMRSLLGVDLEWVKFCLKNQFGDRQPSQLNAEEFDLLLRRIAIAGLANGLKGKFPDEAALRNSYDAKVAVLGREGALAWAKQYAEA